MLPSPNASGPMDALAKSGPVVHPARNRPYIGSGMRFSLIDDDAGAVPLVAVSKSGLAAWRATAPAGERDWVAATGFTGEAGKLALIPDAEGRLGRVLVGMPEGEAAMWAFAGVSDALPEGSYRIAALPEGGDPT